MSAPLTIVQMLPELNVGGVEQGVIDSAAGYVARGHRSIVISAGGRRVAELEAGGSQHITLPVHKKRFFNALRMVHCIGPLLTELRADVVHVRSRVPAWIGYFAAQKARVPLITTVHGFYTPHAYSRIMARGERVIAVSRAIADYAVEQLRADPQKIRLVHRGTVPERFALGWDAATKLAKRCELGLPESGPVVAVIGRITRLKGHDVYLRAVAEVLRTRPDVIPLVVGSVPPKKAAYQAELTALTAALGLRDKAVFTGSRSDVAEVLQVCDVVVGCSTQAESFGRTAMEAMAAGVPVVASAHGGSLDLVADGETGFLTPVGDHDALAKALLTVLNSADGGAAMGRAGRDKVRAEFTLDSMVERTLDVYREVCN